jgi:KTSC domain-containing protein
MDRKRVNASTIRSVGYDPGRQLLEVEFSSGSIVQ